MAKNIIFYLAILLFYSCNFTKRNNDVIPEVVPIVITETDTIYVEVQIPKTLQEKYIDALKKYLGTREATGNNDGPMVAYILKNCGILFEAPWCACFLHQGLLDIGLSGPKHQPAFTPRWFEDPRRIRWVRDKNSINDKIEMGWIGGIYFRNLKRIGHVFAVIEDFGDGYLLTIEGNTNAQGGREGDGVYIRIRHKTEAIMYADHITQYD